MSYYYQEPDPDSIGNRRTPQTLTSMMFSFRASEVTQVNQSCVTVNRSFSVNCISSNNGIRPLNSNPFSNAPTRPIRPAVYDNFPHAVPGATATTLRPARFSSWASRRPQRTQSVLVPIAENNSVRPELTPPNSPALPTRQITTARYNASVNVLNVDVDTMDLCSSFQQNNIQVRGSPRSGTLGENPLELRRKSLEFLNAMIVESKFSEAPITPYSLIKNFLINPTKVEEKIFDGYEGCSEGQPLQKLMVFNCDFKPQLEAHYDSFKVEILLIRLNKTSKKMEKYGVPTRIVINGSTLGMLDFKETPQLNPAVLVPLNLIEDGINCMQMEWSIDALPKDSEVYLSMALVQKLTDTDLLAMVLRRPLIDRSSTINMIKGVIDRSVADGVMENGSFMEVTLVCPLGKSRMLSPCRATTCTHYSCFDVEAFLQMTKVLPTWKCPICCNQINYDDIRIDGYFEDIVRSCDKGTQRVRINSNGDWEVTNYKEKDYVTSSGCPNGRSFPIIATVGDENIDPVPMDFSSTSTKKNLARQSIEIIFEKPVKRFKPNN